MVQPPFNAEAFIKIVAIPYNMTQEELKTTSRITTGLMSSNKQDWGTPKEFITWIEENFSMKIDLDVCAHSENNKCDAYFTIEDNAFDQDWYCVNGWMNPPYNNIVGFLEKCIEEVFVMNNAENMWVLIPARTDTKWFHDLVVPWAEHIYFIKGRIHHKTAGNEKQGSSPFPSMLIHFTCAEELDGAWRYQMKTLRVPKDARGFSK